MIDIRQLRTADIRILYNDYLGSGVSSTLLNEIASMGVKTRSAFIKCCQAQSFVTHDQTGTLSKIVNDAPDSWIDGHNSYYSSNQEFSYHYKEMLKSPVSSAILLDLLRGVPLERPEVIEAFQSSIRGEVDCMMKSPTRLGRINWRCIFSPQASAESMIPELPPNRPMNLYLYGCLTDWLKQVSGRVFFPRMTQKNMSFSTLGSFRNIILQNPHPFGQGYYEMDNGAEEFTQVHAQWVYHHTGYKVSGETEVRTKWYASGPKPRTYYAMGGYHYFKSCHLQTPFTLLVNSNRMTHHVSRLLPQLLVIPVGKRVYIYDFKSFTSEMDTQREFCQHLAHFAEGTPFTYFDAREGIVTRDLGDVLREYNESCVIRPAVTIHRVASRVGLPIEAIQHHENASCLGIFGNLMTCTFAHNAVVSQACASEDENATAGDDGAIVEDDESHHYVECAACSIGIFEPTKNFSSDSPPCIALKRPFRHIPGLPHADLGVMPIPPSYWSIRLVVENNPTDPRYHIDQELTRIDHYIALAKSIFRYLRSLYFNRERLSMDQHITGVLYCRKIAQLVQMCGFPCPHEGCLPLCSGQYFWPLIPQSEADMEKDPAQLLVDRHYDGMVLVHRRGDYEEPPLTDPGHSFLSKSTAWLSLLEKLGYYEKDFEEVMLSGIDGYNHLVRLYTEPTPVVYKYTCIREVPRNLLM